MTTVTKLHYCYFPMCHKKIVHRCLECDRDFCVDHWARSTAWGKFFLGSDTILTIDYKDWQFLVCDQCSRKGHVLTWLEFVRRFPFFVKYVTDPKQIGKCWRLFKQIHDLDQPETSYQEKNRWAKLYFPSIKNDYLELEEPLTFTFVPQTTTTTNLPSRRIFSL